MTITINGITKGIALEFKKFLADFDVNGSVDIGEHSLYNVEISADIFKIETVVDGIAIVLDSYTRYWIAKEDFVSISLY